ncbi:MAG: DUF697 domain-containing protein [Microcoleaceae cyanobacterium]
MNKSDVTEQNIANPAALSDLHWKRAKAGLKKALNRYTTLRNEGKHTDAEILATLQTQLDLLKVNLDQLEQGVIRIAVFGLVSRGKSAVLNALLGEKILQTGPLNGVTQWPRSIRWNPVLPATLAIEERVINVDLIDTPGLDEVAGQIRGEMAKEVVREADLILFVVAGDVTRTEYDALAALRQEKKPLIVVFNKIDLYTETERQKIYDNLRYLAPIDQPATINTETISEENLLDVVMVSAEPAPLSVRVEWPDGRVTYEQEQPLPEIHQLKQKITQILQNEGRSLLALNSLVRARDTESLIAQKIVKLKDEEAEELIWQFAKYKALAVALNPIAVLDVLGTAAIDLVLIRSLAKLYNLPMTGFAAGKLWQAIMTSTGGILIGEWGGSMLMGTAKFDITSYTGIAITQAAIAAYGSYIIGKATKQYLAEGSTWGPAGADTIIQEILDQVDRDTVINRLRQELLREKK